MKAGVDCFEHTGLATAPGYPEDILAGLRTREDYDELVHSESDCEFRLSLRGQRHGQQIRCFINVAEAPEALASPHIVIKHFSTRYNHDEIRAASLYAVQREKAINRLTECLRFQGETQRTANAAP